MAYPMGEADKGTLRLDFDRRLMLQFRGSTITSDAGLLAYRQLDDALSLTDTGADTLADARTGKNGRHRLAGLLRLEFARWRPVRAAAARLRCRSEPADRHRRRFPRRCGRGHRAAAARSVFWFHIVDDERPITRITRAGRLTPHLRA